MIRLALADLRDSWVAWLGVSVAFITLQFALALSVIVIMTSQTSRSALGEDGAQLLMADGVSNLVLCSLVGLAVIGAATSLVITSRRQAIARLLLGGATPGQVTRMISTQIAAVALVTGVIGAGLAIALAPGALRIIAEDRDLASVPPSISLATIVATTLGCALLCMLGGLRQARAASAIPPVEALRVASGAPTRPHGWIRRTLRVLQFVAAAGFIALMLGWIRIAGPEMGEDLASQVTQMAFLAIPLAGLALVAILPWLVGPVTRAWTGALPIRSASWHLARQTVLAKRERLIRSIIPVMFAVGLVFGLMMVGQTFSNVASAVGVELEGSSPTSLLTFIGMALAVAVAGGVGNLVMMSRQRSAELALDGVIGATPRQQVLVPVFEALIITVTASVLGLVMALVGALLLVSGLSQALPGLEIGIPVALLGWSVVVCLVVITMATVLPVLRSLREPAPAVIARLVAA